MTSSSKEIRSLKKHLEIPLEKDERLQERIDLAKQIALDIKAINRKNELKPFGPSKR